MHYEINISKNGQHYFATAARSLTVEWEAKRLYSDFLVLFPVDKGFEITVTEWNTIGKAADFKKDTAPARISDLEDYTPDASDIELIVRAITLHGTDDHPAANVRNFNDFLIPYILECLEKFEENSSEGLQESITDLAVGIHMCFEDQGGSLS